MTKLQLQNLDQTLKPCDQSEQKLNYTTKLHLTNLHQTVVKTFLSININNLNKYCVCIFTRQGHINQMLRSELVSQ